MITQQGIIWGVVFPLIAAAVILLGSSLPWRRGRARSAAPWGPPLAIAVGFALAYTGIAGRPSFPPIEAGEWLVYFAPASVIVGGVMTIAPRWAALGIALSVLTLAALMCLVLRPPTFATWTLASLMALGMVAWWAAMEALSLRLHHAGATVLLLIFTIAAALVLMNSATQRFAQLAGAVAIVLGVMVLARWVLEISPAGGGVLAVAITVLGLLVAGHFFAEVSLAHLALVALAPMAAWVRFLPGLRKRRWLAITAATVAVAVLMSLVLVPTIQGLNKMYKEEVQSIESF